MTPLNDDALRALARDLAADVGRHAPEWTGVNESDPGITILELFAYLIEQLLYRAPVSAHTHPLVNHLIADLRTLGHQGASSSGLRRVRYFEGQLLTADDLRTDQDYFRAKSRLQNRWLVGAGVIKGLDVTIDSAPTGNDEPLVRVSPGSAIAPDGELLVIETPRHLGPLRESPTYVVVRYVEHAVCPVITPIGTSEPSRIEERVSAALVPSPAETEVTIARIERHEDRWHLIP